MASSLLDPLGDPATPGFSVGEDQDLEPTNAVVHLEALRHNLGEVRRLVGPERKILVAVKANAYGHGSEAVAQLIQDTGAADWLGVATTSEGAELRAAGITLPILKLSGVLSAREAAIAATHDVTVGVPSRQAARWCIEGARAAGRPVHVHLKVDTGMRRIGTEPSETVAAARMLEAIPEIVLDGMFTHLPVSDTPGQDEFTHAQITTFYDLVAEVEEALGRPLPLVHCANSGAVVAQPLALGEGRVDPSRVMVRPGIMAYGYLPDPAMPTPTPLHLRPVMELVTRVAFVKDVKAGETVGYGRAWTAPRDTRIATITAGYADGYSRLLSNRGRALIGGESHPIAGRVCMDQTMVDLGPDGHAEVGDEVVLIGRQGEEQISGDEVAGLMGTIVYEVMCLITPRVARVYVD